MLHIRINVEYFSPIHVCMQAFSKVVLSGASLGTVLSSAWLLPDPQMKFSSIEISSLIHMGHSYRMMILRHLQQLDTSMPDIRLIVVAKTGHMDEQSPQCIAYVRDLVSKAANSHLQWLGCPTDCCSMADQPEVLAANNPFH